MNESWWSSKRGRGRPIGTGKQDGPDLREIARRLAGDQRLKPTTVIKQIVGADNPSTIRRLQAKWRKCGPALLRDDLELQHIEPYDPACHADAPIGTVVRINPYTDPELKQHADAHGYHAERGVENGEWILRRHLWAVTNRTGV